MKTLKLTMVALFTVFVFQANAQVVGIPGGTILMGGSMGFTSSSSKTTIKGSGIASDSIVNGSQFQFSLAPKMGYFFVRNFCAGMTINFSTASRTTKGDSKTGTPSKTESESQLLAGPFFRYYYFPSNRVGLFGEVEVGLGAGSVGSGGKSNTVGQFSFGIGPGLTFFANDIVAIEAVVKYNMLTQTTSIDTGTQTLDVNTKIGKIDFGVGFQFYFNRVIGGGPSGAGTGM